MGRHVSIAIRMAFVTMIAFGVIYPLAMTGIAQVVFPRQANGSLVRRGARVVGSELIGQSFVEAGYFHPRPSAAGDGYAAASSGGSNLGPTSRKFVEQVKDRTNSAVRENPGLKPGRVPVDMVTASGSGLDPDISVTDVHSQVQRIAKTRGMSEADVRTIVSQNTTPRQFGFLGEPRVNVLRINTALDESGRNDR